ncbi:CHAT domain-containing protein [Phormidium tenue]|uniref:Tetratricopeptide repeat protein n=1 Tax=Phormidium tenue FACHB-1050 TaxID=2692857 RepID=A0ABR8CIB0_9CYAN|nr:tetratricopeptide repeat protein [Phormidium tenue]MBD2319762.1 tetratricopeptide repeat protein [Phormidium tenue FACHB-1050]
MNLDSRKGGVRASRFYALMFVALTGILGMVSPPDLALMTAQAQTTQDRKAEADRLLQQGNQQYQISQFEAAFQSWQQALIIYREIKDRLGEGNALGNLGAAYYSLGKYDKAIEFQLQSLEIRREIKDRNGEGKALGNLGNAYTLLGKYDKAIEFYLQYLAIAREIKDRLGEGSALGNLGEAYRLLGKYDKAIEFYLQHLAIAREIKYRIGEGSALGNLGLAYTLLGKYDKAIEFYLQSLEIAREIKDRNGEGKALGNLGIAYRNLGKYDKAIEFYLQSLEIAREIKYRLGEGKALGNLGVAYALLGKYDKAIEFYLQYLAIAREIKDRLGEGNAIGSLGNVYQAIGKYDKAIEFHLQVLAIAREIKDRNGEGTALHNLAVAYQKLNRDREAMISYQQALTIAREIGDRSIEGYALANLGDVLSRAKRPELAILFYKQSINVREAIRKDISKLDKDIQKSYLATVEYTYRNLADLLLKQDRILEAQQVLDLLKVEELNEYLRTPTRSSQTEQGTELRNQEKTFIALALELDELQKRKLANNITAAEQERLNKLVKSEQEQQNQFIAFLDSDPVQTLVEELRLKERQQNVDITNNFQNLRTDILAQHPNAVLLYPLILEDRLELILITAKTTPIRRTINIKREKLNQEITDFLAGLRDSGSEDVKKPAQQMYTWLIKPFETELAELKIDTIIYAPDGQLRYIPLAALYDGKQWLIEKYRVNNITAASLTKFNKPPIATPKIFAGAFGNVNKQGFSGLPATLTEVKKIADRFPNTTTLVETAFTKELTTTNSNSYTILHLATHGQLSTGDPKDSFIIFGDGEKATIKDIRTWALTNVDLVVLSACQSGLGAKLGSGVEILGLGYQMQAAGARVAIASLWKVDDAGTQALMEAFYGELKKGDVSIVEALRRAQIAMINSDKKGTDSSDRAGVRIVGTVPTSSTLSHPYYWSAFFAIGNGL